MRAQGLLSEPGAVQPADHVCWTYEDVDSFAPVARQFLAGGLARGERLLCVGDDVVDRIRRGVEPLADVDALLDRGALELLPLGDAYDSTAGFAPEQQLTFYEAATRRARADGHRGIRVVADVTALAADPGRRADLLRWEHLADDFMASGSGMSAMCAYRSSVLDAGVVVDAASVHPVVHAPGGAPPFRVFFDDGRVAVAGEVDAVGAARLRRVLATSCADRSAVTLDLSRVEFVDVAGCRLVAEWARGLRDRSAEPRLTGTSPLFRRMWRLLRFDELTGVSPEGRHA
ncbi:MEDS domain-containing protein [Geodermatophilus sp. YIM 151500]|uniref:MEDS domain-containing protein n=1 Tax=Geodermatophilus sp. YIM 151500 TaxID=2984531 RepID=UPI0021E4ED78|nr:MEDS domain-containing protein [Geodermatophilus sp. YIM 151500]MCV2490939.1 MEDS domain-containing protein [Geodermatophilus sp. YIM 151500]